MLTRRAALMGAAGIAAIPVLAKAVEAEEIMDTSMAEPADLSNLQRIKRRLPHDQIATRSLNRGRELPVRQGHFTFCRDIQRTRNLRPSQRAIGRE